MTTAIQQQHSHLQNGYGTISLSAPSSAPTAASKTASSSTSFGKSTNRVDSGSLVSSGSSAASPSSSRSHLSSSIASSSTAASSLGSLRSGEKDERVCDHLVNVLQADASFEQRLRLLSRASSGTKRASTKDTFKKRRRLDSTRWQCESCPSAISVRPLVCLECGVVCCGKTETDASNHSALHAKQMKHQLSFDMRSAAVFCHGCDDYIYNSILDRMLVNLESSTHTTLSLATTAIQKFDRSEFVFHPRGLRNLGQTCFMSCVLQCFLHNPLLRAYFLSDQHHRDLCENTTESVDGRTTKACLGCEMDQLFTEFCSTETAVPFGPTSFLYTMWQCSSELSGYAQQDSHEFLISALNLIHSATPHSTNEKCGCVVHSVFGGQLRSDVQCGQCGNVTQSLDPVLDLSLDLRSGLTHAAGMNTLIGCLKRFTSPEMLQPSQYVCAACGESKKGASKQLSIKQLPPVLCIQLKRFEHAVGSQKIDSPVRFPLTLNMRDYTSAALSMSIADKAVVDPMFDYDLISVINHEGSLSQGHYTTYCRELHDFYCFDDDKVRRAPVREVLDSKAYILVYLKKTLSYSSSA